MPSSDLHIFFLPFLSPGHMIPMVDFAKLLAIRNVKVTIVTTKYNVPLIQPSIDKYDIQLLTIELSSSIQNLTQSPSPALAPDFIDAIDNLQQPFQHLVAQHKPDFIISDAFYPWTSDLGVPRLLFHISNAFCMVVSSAIATYKLRETVEGDDEPFVVMGVPHRIEMTGSMLTIMNHANGLSSRITDSFSTCYGLVMNTVYGFESEYVDMLKIKAWAVGPVSMCNDDGGKNVRGGEGVGGCLEWLDGKMAGSVLYVCFGSLGKFTRAQLREIGLGLVESGCPFLWVVKNGGNTREWMPNGYDEEKGLVVTDWAPQLRILNHASVGGFMTHCGWNSCLEGASAGLPMATWPLFAEQFYNERLLVDVMKIGVSVGSKVCNDDEEKRTLVNSEDVKRAVVEVMSEGKEADERRMRAQEAAKMAKEAVEEGGSSHKEIDSSCSYRIGCRRTSSGRHYPSTRWMGMKEVAASVQMLCDGNWISP